MIKGIVGFVGFIFVAVAIYFAGIYYITFSNGFRSGELIKVSNKGLLFKTWEGEISQGVSEAQRFQFSVEDREDVVIEDLKRLQGKVVMLTYKERFSTFPWLGDTVYFITKVEEVGASEYQY